VTPDPAIEVVKVVEQISGPVQTPKPKPTGIVTMTHEDEPQVLAIPKEAPKYYEGSAITMEFGYDLSYKEPEPKLKQVDEVAEFECNASGLDGSPIPTVHHSDETIFDKSKPAFGPLKPPKPLQTPDGESLTPWWSVKSERRKRSDKSDTASDAGSTLEPSDNPKRPSLKKKKKKSRIDGRFAEYEYDFRSSELKILDNLKSTFQAARANLSSGVLLSLYTGVQNPSATVKKDNMV
jgi:hypothetical protein